MNIGRTSVIVFIAKLISSALGFIGTIYFVRLLGAEVIGIYSLIMTLSSWLMLANGPGLNIAARKQISAGEDPEEYFAASIITFVCLFSVIASLTILFAPYVESYISEFSTYSAISVVWFVIGILIINLIFKIIQTVLEGNGQVHISGILEPTRVGLRSGIQILFVSIGFGILGLLYGYLIGVFIISLLGVLFVSIRPKTPRKKHFRELIAFTKYSSLGGLKSRSLNHADILILGIFVSPTLVGIYAVSWMLVKFLDLFGTAITRATFPEISKITTQNEKADARDIIEDSIAFAGLISIPGTIGGYILAERLLRIYDPEFVQATEILFVLLLSILSYSYMRQFMNSLNALDHPELAFRTNILFIFTNIMLNFILISWIGWIGAAVASFVSSFSGLIISYKELKSILKFTVPSYTILRQVAAALLMGVVVFLTENLIETTQIITGNFIIVCMLVLIGVSVYSIVLFAVSPLFKNAVLRNLPNSPI